MLPPLTQLLPTRAAAQRCAGCNVWGEQLVYMQNGRHYCVPCARKLRDFMGITPAGKRTDDSTTRTAAEDERIPFVVRAGTGVLADSSERDLVRTDTGWKTVLPQVDPADAHPGGARGAHGRIHCGGSLIPAFDPGVPP